MIDKKSLTKRYYSITEVAKLFDVSNSLLRYWESEFKSIRPAKGRNGIRRYTVEDIIKIETVYDLLKNRGFTIDGARKEIKMAKKEPADPDAALLLKLNQLKSRLKSIRSKIEE